MSPTTPRWVARVDRISQVFRPRKINPMYGSRIGIAFIPIHSVELSAPRGNLAGCRAQGYQFGDVKHYSCFGESHLPLEELPHIDRLARKPAVDLDDG